MLASLPYEIRIVLGVVGVAVGILLAIGIVFLVLAIRNSIYKSYVLANSESLKRLKDLNNQYVFEEFDKHPRIRFRFDNKRNWYRTEPAAFLARTIREDLDHWFEIRRQIERNRELLEKYEKEAEALRSYIPQEKCRADGKSYEKCKETERVLFDKEKKAPATDIKVDVNLRYVSPAGKVDVSKSGVFDYVALVRIVDSVSTYRVDRKTYEHLVAAERGILTDSMRYDVLKRDGFRCVLCGMSAKDGAMLHVDHIIPVSKGGKTTMDNLRTLCEKCNLGKSNKIE